MRIITVCCALLLLLNTPVNAQTPVSAGSVHGTWALANSPYLINGDITVPNDSTLIIEPGVIIEFQGYYALDVQGRLLALGTENDQILFTRNDTTGFGNADTSLGGWTGIRIADTSPVNDSTLFSYCTFEHAKAVDSLWWFNAGGAITIINFDKVRISNCTFSYNSAGGSDNAAGGAISFAFSDIIITESTISNNRAEIGGGIHFYESEPFVIGSTISDNTALQSGAISVEGLSNARFINCNFINNHATGVAGAMGCWGPSTVMLDNVSFSNNTANTGGAIYSDYCDLNIKNSLFSDNSADVGGCMQTGFGMIQIDNSTFQQNHANWIGAINAYNCDLQIDNSVFTGNQALEGNAGAIEYAVDEFRRLQMQNIDISNTQFIENTAAAISGGLLISQNDSDTARVNVQIDHCEFISNGADRFGAIRFNHISDFSISNCFIKGNTSLLWVGGIGFATCSGKVYNSVFINNYANLLYEQLVVSSASSNINARVDFMNCTFTNASDIGTDLNSRRGSYVSVTNSVFWGQNPRPLASVTEQSLGAILEVNRSCVINGLDSVKISDSLSSVVWGAGNISDNPLFVDAAADDLHMQSSSPCIGAGIDSILIDTVWNYVPPNDMDGYPRPNPPGSFPDMGAYEHDRASPSGLDAQHAMPNYLFRLAQNYPNPFNPTTHISFVLPKRERVRIEIFNMLGQKLKKILDHNYNRGVHAIAFNAGTLASGIYYYRITAGRYTDSKKMLLLK